MEGAPPPPPLHYYYYYTSTSVADTSVIPRTVTTGRVQWLPKNWKTLRLFRLPFFYFPRRYHFGAFPSIPDGFLRREIKTQYTRVPVSHLFLSNYTPPSVSCYFIRRYFFFFFTNEVTYSLFIFIFSIASHHAQRYAAMVPGENAVRYNNPMSNNDFCTVSVKKSFLLESAVFSGSRFSPPPGAQVLPTILRSNPTTYALQSTVCRGWPYSVRRLLCRARRRRTEKRQSSCPETHHSGY